MEYQWLYSDKTKSENWWRKHECSALLEVKTSATKIIITKDLVASTVKLFTSLPSKLERFPLMFCLILIASTLAYLVFISDVCKHPRHKSRKTTALSCCRCLISTVVEKINNI